MTTLTYASTLNFCDYLGISRRIPEWNVGSTPSNELVGTGDSSNTIFWADQRNIIAGTYTLYYGATAAATTTLTETTHYTIDKDLGKITLTSAGVTLLSTSNIYAVYKYTDLSGDYSGGSGASGIGVPDSLISTYLTRAQSWIDEQLNTHFAVSTDTTPDWEKVTDEKLDGMGQQRKDYYLNNFPVKHLTTLTDGSLTAANATVTVDSTAGFPSTGSIVIESEKITYTGKTSTTFTGCTRGVDDSDGATHVDNSTVTSTVVEISLTSEGSTPEFQVLEVGSQYDINETTGRIWLYDTSGTLVISTPSGSYLPLSGVPSRFRASYLSGYSTIPEEITRITIMIAARDMTKSGLLRTLISGSSNAPGDSFSVSNSEVEEVLSHYRNTRISIV